MTPWYFPLIWLYVLAGVRKLLALFHRGSAYEIIVPQDGVFTGAFAALAAKLVGVRVICIDHGDLGLLVNPYHHIYRSERQREVASKNWPWLIRHAARLSLVFYWPCRSLLARVTAHLADHYLIPGVADDGVDGVCKRLGVRSSKITRFANMIDVERHIIPSADTRSRICTDIGLPLDAIVIAIVCRLAPEKGLEVVLATISQALLLISVEVRIRVRVIVVGDRPLRRSLERDISEPVR